MRQFNGTLNAPSLSLAEQRMHFFLWALFPSPLILSFDATSLAQHPDGAACLGLVANPEVLAVNQDPLVEGARLLHYDGANYSTSPNPTPAITTMVWGRRLDASGHFAAVLLNRGSAASTMVLDFAALGLADPQGPAAVRNLGQRQDAGVAVGQWTVEVPAHDAVMVSVVQTL